MRVIKNSLIYLLSSVISKGAPFLLLPFLTKYLPPEEFGVLAIFLVLNSMMGAFVGMSMHANVTKNFFRKAKPELALITGNVFFVLLTTTTLYFLFMLVVAASIEAFFSVPSEYLLILPPLAFLAMANQIHLAVLRNEGRAYAFGAFELTNAFLGAGITIVCLIIFDVGWISQVIGLAVATLIVSVIGVLYMFKRGYLNFTFDRKEVSSILRLSFPLIPHVLGGVAIATSDRLFIEKLVGLETVSLYAIGYSFGKLVTLLTDAFIKAWCPWFYQQLVEPTHERKAKIVKFTYLYLVGVFAFAYIISVAGEWLLPYIVDIRYHDAAKFIWWIALGYAIQGVYKIFFPYLVHISRTAFLAFSTVTAAIFNIIFNYFLIPQYGAMGAAYGTIMAFSISALLVFEYQRRHYPMPWYFCETNK